MPKHQKFCGRLQMKFYSECYSTLRSINIRIGKPSFVKKAFLYQKIFLFYNTKIKTFSELNHLSS